MDERNKLIAYKVIAIMYFLTIIAILGIVLYRQFALGQDIRDFEDIAILLTVNSLFLISALLFFGAIPIQQLSVKAILLVYASIVVGGSLFTYLKYNVFQDAQLSLSQLAHKLYIIMVLCAIILFFFVIFSVLGKRKLENELND